MKKIFVITFTILSLINTQIIFAQNRGTNEFDNPKILVIAGKEDQTYSFLVTNRLSSDNKYNFMLLENYKTTDATIAFNEYKNMLAQGKNPNASTYINNIYYVIEISHPYIMTSEETTTKETEKTDFNGKKVLDIFGNPEIEKTTSTQYTTRITATVYLTKIKEGNKVLYYSINESCTSSDSIGSYNYALKNFDDLTYKFIKDNIPIQAKMISSTNESITLSRGSKTGVEKGQRYIIKDLKQISNNSKGNNDSVIFQIDSVNEDTSKGYYIFGNNKNFNKSCFAEEKRFWNIALEFFTSGNYYTDTDSHIIKRGEYIEDKFDNTFGPYDICYSLNFLFGYQWQFGFGASLRHTDIFTTPGVSSMLRYNWHVYRQFFLSPYIEGGLIIPITKTEIMTSSNAFGGTIDKYGNYNSGKYMNLHSVGLLLKTGANVTIMLSKNIYISVGAGYTISQKIKDWNYSPDSSETSEVKLQSITEYDNYINKYSATGQFVQIGIGVLN